jgi:hypothetical protein
MALGLFALLAAMWGGLLRMGWRIPLLAGASNYHGPLMVSGFLGTLIGLERAVALKRLWAYLGPAATGAGALALAFDLQGSTGPLLMTLGSACLVLVFAAIVRSQPALFTVTLGLGAVCWLVGNLLWLANRPIFMLVFWWAGFLVLTIWGERLELARMRRPPRAALVLYALATLVVLAGLALSVSRYALGARVTGLGFVALAAWLARYDVAWRTVRMQGLTRYIALCLLSGYFWLAAGGILTAAYAGIPAGPLYDAMLHCVFLGFVFSMIFGHAPTIFPAVTGLPVPYRRSFYAHLGLLHFSLALRLAGDLGGWASVRQWGGLLNVAAILLFLAATLRFLPSALGARKTGEGR